MTEVNFRFAKVADENLSRFAEMYLLCLGAKVDDAYFNWKYLNNPAGRVIAFEALDGEKPAGFYGVIPERYLVNGKEILAYQSMDTMTHPSYQKRGLFTKLAKLTYEEVIAKDPNAFIVGIPGSNSFYGFVNKLDWKNPHHFSYMFSNKWLSLPARKISAQKMVSFEEKNRISEELEVFLNTINQKARGIQPLVDKLLLEWKILQHPTKMYKLLEIRLGGRLVGYSVYLINEKQYVKLEMVKIDGVELSTALASLSNYIYDSTGTSFIYTWEPTTETLKKAFSRAGFYKNPFSKGPFSYKVPFIVYSKAGVAGGVDLSNIRNYDLQPMMQD